MRRLYGSKMRLKSVKGGPAQHRASPPRFSECVLHTQGDDISVEVARRRTVTAGVRVTLVIPVRVPRPLRGDVELEVGKRRHPLRSQRSRNLQGAEQFCLAAYGGYMGAAIQVKALVGSPVDGPRDKGRGRGVVSVDAQQVAGRGCIGGGRHAGASVAVSVGRLRGRTQIAQVGPGVDHIASDVEVETDRLS